MKEIILHNQTWKEITKDEAVKMFNDGMKIMFCGDKLKTTDYENENIFYVFKSEQDETIETYQEKYLGFYSRNIEKGFVYFAKTLFNKVPLFHRNLEDLACQEIKRMLVDLLKEAVRQGNISKKYQKYKTSDIYNVIIEKNDYCLSLENLSHIKICIRYKIKVGNHNRINDTFYIQFDKIRDTLKNGKEKYIKFDIALLGKELDEILLV